MISFPHNLRIAALLITFSYSASAVVLFKDTFDHPNTTNFDSASTAGRISGLLSQETELGSHGAQQFITGNQVFTTTGGAAAGLRFQRTPPTGGGPPRYDFASGSASSLIILNGGFTVSFEWTPENNSISQWVGWAIGTPNMDVGAFVVNQAEVDYAILFRNNGDTQRFDNGSVRGDGGSFSTTPGGTTTYFVEIDYSFSSFADGTSVNAVARVDGTEVANDAFSWDGNDGSLYMEFATNQTGNSIDNLTITSIPEPTVGMLSTLATIIILRRRRVEFSETGE